MMWFLVNPVGLCVTARKSSEAKCAHQLAAFLFAIDGWVDVFAWGRCGTGPNPVLRDRAKPLSRHRAKPLEGGDARPGQTSA